jgi:hypothetical protein
VASFQKELSVNGIDKHRIANNMPMFCISSEVEICTQRFFTRFLGAKYSLSCEIAVVIEAIRELCGGDGPDVTLLPTIAKRNMTGGPLWAVQSN